MKGESDDEMDAVNRRIAFLVTGCQSQHGEEQVIKQDRAVPVMQQAQSEMKQQGF